MCGCGATVGTAGQTGQILLDDVMGAALVEIACGGTQAGQILFDHRRLLAGHAAGRGAAAAAAAAGGTAGAGGGMQMATQTGIMPGTVRRHAQRHGARQPQIEGGQLSAGLWPGIEEAGSGGRGGAHDAATVHAQGIVRNNFGGRIGTLGIIAGIHFARSRTVGTERIAQWARCVALPFSKITLFLFSSSCCCCCCTFLLANCGKDYKFYSKNLFNSCSAHFTHSTGKIHFGFLSFLILNLL